VANPDLRTRQKSLRFFNENLTKFSIFCPMSDNFTPEFSSILTSVTKKEFFIFLKKMISKAASSPFDKKDALLLANGT
jgi:adenylyl- and sulfurtransferase ThiI